jgi:hypothetical protein
MEGSHGSKKVSLRIVAVATLLAAACATTTASSVVQQQMSAKASCPAKDIAVTELLAYGYRAEGCGQAGTFICIPGGDQKPTCTPQGGTFVGLSAADAGTH